MDQLLVSLEIAAKLIACLVIADLISGFVHWLEDAYGDPKWPITGRTITQANILHHFNPRHFTQHSWFSSARVLMVITAACLGVAYLVVMLNWMTWVVAVIAVNSNEVHKWSHRRPKENPRIVRWFQATGVLQSSAQHAKHHRDDKNTDYCVVTNYSNPVLEGVRFWRGLEWLIHRTTGVRRRPDESVPPMRRTASPPKCNARACRDEDSEIDRRTLAATTSS